MLEVEWGRATVLRESYNNVLRKPTPEEASELRATINTCKHFTSEFDLTGGPGGADEVWGTATLINLAVELDDVLVLDELVSDGHSVSGLPNSLDISTLYIATYRQMRNAFQWSLKNGVDPNLADVDGTTPLMLATMSPQDQFASISILLEAGARIDSLDSAGRSALVFAIRSQQYENAHILVRAGADVALARKAMVTELGNANTDFGVNHIQKAIDFLDHNFAEIVTD